VEQNRPSSLGAVRTRHVPSKDSVVDSTDHHSSVSFSRVINERLLFVVCQAASIVINVSPDRAKPLHRATRWPWR